MLSFDENGWLFPDPLKNITHDIDSAEIDDLLKLAKEEDYWSAGIRETVKKRLEKDKDDVRLDWIVEDLMIKIPEELLFQCLLVKILSHLIVIDIFLEGKINST